MRNSCRWGGKPGMVALLGLATATLAQAFTWETADPAGLGVDAPLLDTMAARIETDPHFKYVTSMLVIRQGKIAYEGYFQGTQAGDLRNLHSATKSFTSLAVGIATARGLVPSLDTKILALYPEIAPANPSVFKDEMTLRHVLSMASGHAAEAITTNNWVRDFLDYPVTSQPGTRFFYEGSCPLLLSAIMQKKTGAPLQEFVAANIFSPLGITHYEWPAAANGMTNGATGLRLTTRDLGKFGLLCLQRGLWDNAQIVPAAYIDDAGSKHISNGDASGFWSSGYGYQFWLNDFGSYRADGAYGQLVIILPRLDTVVVLTSASQWSGYGLAPAITLLYDYAMPALRASAGDAQAPQLTASPVAARAEVGAPARFAATATGADLRYHWYRGDEVIGGENKPELVLPATATTDAGNYSVVVSNPSGSVRSTAVALTVVPPNLSLTLSAVPPARKVVAWGQTTTLSVTAASAGTLTYQWSRNGRPIPGATQAQFAIVAAGRGDAGTYDVLVSDGTTARRSPVCFVAVSVPRARVATWGPNVAAGIPSELADVVAVTPLVDPIGSSNGVTLRADGTVTTWGTNPHSTYAPPTGLNEVVALARGRDHNLALRSDGTVIPWGFTLFGDGTGLANGVAIAAGNSCSYALRRDGRIIPWAIASAVNPDMRRATVLTVGDSTDGYSQLAIALRDDGSAGYADLSNAGSQGWGIPSYTRLTAVAAGYRHLLFAKEDHTVEAWYAEAATDLGQAVVPAGLTRVVAVSAHRNTSLALRDDSTVVTWGDNSTGLRNLPTGLSKIVSIDASGIALCDLSGVPWFAHELLDNQTVTGGTDAVFTVQASDSPTYQWQESTDGGATWTNVSDRGSTTGSASNRLTLGLVSTTLDGRYYRCLATNTQGSAKTSPAKLTVTTPPPPPAPPTPPTPTTPSSGGGGGGGALDVWLLGALAAIAAARLRRTRSSPLQSPATARCLSPGRKQR